jgi:hypothetical protein
VFEIFQVQGSSFQIPEETAVKVLSVKQAENVIVVNYSKALQGLIHLSHLICAYFASALERRCSRTVTKGLYLESDTQTWVLLGTAMDSSTSRDEVGLRGVVGRRSSSDFDLWPAV